MRCSQGSANARICFLSQANFLPLVLQAMLGYLRATERLLFEVSCSLYLWASGQKARQQSIYHVSLRIACVNSPDVHSDRY